MYNLYIVYIDIISVYVNAKLLSNLILLSKYNSFEIMHVSIIRLNLCMLLAKPS